MNDEEIKIVKSMIKSKEKLLKLIARIDKLPDEQRKKLEAMNLIGPKHDEEMDVLIKEHKEHKKWFKSQEKPKTAYEDPNAEILVFD